MSPSDPELDFTKRPLYAYDLPPHLLSTLVLKTTTTTPEDTATTPNEDRPPSTATSCNLCAFVGSSVAQQREHVKSDFHAFNTKRRARGIAAVTEGVFEELVQEEGALSSISGSEDSSDAEEPLSTQLSRKAVLSSRRKPGPGNAPIQWYTSPLLPANTALGVYRALFPAPDTDIAALQNTKDRHVFVLLLGGGHFAAMIISLTPKPDRSVAVLAHKTFHRYTTRRKQGGSQSSNDASKGNAHSAGAGIRRANEAALTSEIRALLQSWKSLIDAADLCFVRASGTQNRKTVFGYEGAVLRSEDPRVRGFPFTTRRATQKECVRAFTELTRCKLSTLTLEALTPAPPSSAPAIAAPRLSPPPTDPAEEEAAHHSTQLTSLTRRSKAPALLSYLQTHHLSASAFRLSPPSHHAPTLLHLASSLSSPAVVTALLTKADADPTVENSDGKTAFELAGDRATRDAFRVARFEMGEGRWEWERARVPKGVGREEVRRRVVEEEVGRGRVREEEVKRVRGEVGEEGRSRRGVLAGLVKGGEERGLSDDAKRRLERERRARAAEERIRRMQGGG